MTSFCIIGCQGHLSSSVQAARSNPGLYNLTGIAPGCPEEDISPLAKQIEAAGLRPNLYDSYEAMLRQTKPDVAVVCPWFGLTAGISAYALDRGMHVFSEKPLATTLPDLLTLEQAASRSRGRLSAMLTYRYDPSFYAAFQAVRAGRIGTIRMAHAQKSYKLGSRPDFYKSRDTYGGTISWVGIHAIDWLAWLTGERFERVSAQHSTWENGGHGELEVVATAQFKMTGHCLATMTCDYCRPSSAQTHGDDRIRLVGTSGVLEVTGQTVTVLDGDGTTTIAPADDSGSFEDFIRYTQGRADVRLTQEDSLYATRAALLTLQAADTGRTVDF